jgi:hypothetical protein
MMEWDDWKAYPTSWPRDGKRSQPIGLVPLDDNIRAQAARRLMSIRHDLKNAGPHYPRAAVQDALAYWNIEK